MSFDEIKSASTDYFETALDKFGPVAKGVDYNSQEAQYARFAQVAKLFNKGKYFSLNDYGCGYGALAEYLLKEGYDFSYAGYDISRKMISEAKRLHQDHAFCRFTQEESDLSQADYAVAVAIFNIKWDFSEEKWREWILTCLSKMAELSRRGFAFTMLTKYSDKELMRPDLYYADPCFFFDHCKRNFSRNVALLHDYEIYDFTILVRG